MFQRIKQWLGIEEKPEVEKQQNLEEVNPNQLLVEDCEDPIIEVMLSKLWLTGKAHIATVDDEGNVIFKEVDDGK